MANACAGTCRPTSHVSVARRAGRQEKLEKKVLCRRRAVLAAAVRTLGGGAVDDSLALPICGNGGERARGGWREWRGWPACATSRNRPQIESRSGTISVSSRTGTSRVGTTKKKRGPTAIATKCILAHREIHGQPSHTLHYWWRDGEEGEKKRDGHRHGKADGGCEGTRAIVPRGDRMCVVLYPRGWHGSGSGLLVTNRYDNYYRGNDLQPYDGLVQSGGLHALGVKRSSERRYGGCQSHRFGGSYEARRWRRDPDVSRGQGEGRRKGRCVKASSSVDGDGDGIPFLGGRRQRRRLADLIRSIPELSNAYFHSPWRRLLWGGTSLLGGFYSAHAVTLSFGALGINDIVAAALCLFSAEFVTRYYYSRARPAFFLTLLNLFKLGFTCGLFVDAFKLAL